ncbi:MAG: sigma-70 family RNA polymerase sigma factor [Verrucomicrobiales bacterium]|nr:sigma-70 family RNA polymerase sigma factor [Verrucomicrobiales bacterium]
MPDDPLVTRQTLLLRLRDRADEESWREFAEIYTPLLYRYCQKREIKAQDAADIVQEVMRSVSLAMENFEYDPEKGKFKGWLFTAVRNAISAHYRKMSKRPVTAAETGMVRKIEETPDEREEKDWEREYQRELMSWAMEKVRPEFAERIWNAFEMTALQGKSPSEVAEETGMTKNAVTLAKFRVVKRLREKTASIDSDKWEREVIARKD